MLNVDCLERANGSLLSGYVTNDWLTGFHVLSAPMRWKWTQEYNKQCRLY